MLGKAEKDDLDGLADLGFHLPDSAYLQAPRLSQVQEEEATEAPERSLFINTLASRRANPSTKVVVGKRFFQLQMGL